MVGYLQPFYERHDTDAAATSSVVSADRRRAAAVKFRLVVPVEHFSGRRDEHRLDAGVSALGGHQIRCTRLG